MRAIKNPTTAASEGGQAGPFLRTEDAAARVHMAASTLEKLRCRGEGPPYLRLTARRVIYDVAALDAWARARAFTSTAEYATA